jgi:hypothetical protein
MDSVEVTCRFDTLGPICWLYRFIPSLDPWFDCRRNLALATSRSSPAFGGQEITLGKNRRLLRQSVRKHTKHFYPCSSSKLPSLVSIRDSYFASLSYSDTILIHPHTSHGSMSSFEVKSNIPFSWIHSFQDFRTSARSLLVCLKGIFYKAMTGESQANKFGVFCAHRTALGSSHIPLTSKNASHIKTAFRRRKSKYRPLHMLFSVGRCPINAGIAYILLHYSAEAPNPLSGRVFPVRSERER